MAAARLRHTVRSFLCRLTRPRGIRSRVGHAVRGLGTRRPRRVHGQTTTTGGAGSADDEGSGGPSRTKLRRLRKRGSKSGEGNGMGNVEDAGAPSIVMSLSDTVSALECVWADDARGSAEAGDGSAMLRLGQMYMRGFGSVPADRGEAVRWLVRASRLGSVVADEELGMLVSAADREDIQEFHSLADQGNADAALSHVRARSPSATASDGSTPYLRSIDVVTRAAQFPKDADTGQRPVVQHLETLLSAEDLDSPNTVSTPRLSAPESLVWARLQIESGRGEGKRALSLRLRRVLSELRRGALTPSRALADSLRDVSTRAGLVGYRASGRAREAIQCYLLLANRETDDERARAVLVELCKYAEAVEAQNVLEDIVDEMMRQKPDAVGRMTRLLESVAGTANAQRAQ